MANMIVIPGTVGQDPKLTTFNQGYAKVEFSVADSQYDKKAENNRRTVWFNVELFTKEDDGRIKLLMDGLKKGSRVTVFGTLTEEDWQDKDGNARKSQKVLIGRHELPHFVSANFTGGNSSGSTQAPASSQPERTESPAPNGSSFGDEMKEDDLPF